MNGVEDRLGNVEAGLGTLTSNVATLCEDRKTDKASARKEAKERHAELKSLIGDNRAELRKINGAYNKHDTRLAKIEAVDDERKRVAGAGAVRVVTPKRVAQGAGVTGLGGGIIWMLLAKFTERQDLLEKLTELQEVLAQLAQVAGGS